MRPLDIGIIGSGTAGAAAALFLARAGHTVTVYERVEHPRPIGAGILLQPTGQAVLARLGLRDAVVARAAPSTTCAASASIDAACFACATAAIPGGHQGYGLHRGVLFEQLFAALRRSAVTLHLGVEVRDLAVTDDREGQWFVTADGRRLGPHALCIVADGARSQLRDDTVIPKRIRPYPWGALWYVADDPDGVAGRSARAGGRRYAAHGGRPAHGPRTGRWPHA
jgi:2-polyprenyl-6-methoxyphenol hydroxylase-like FAD-dependent oxidoreductase